MRDLNTVVDQLRKVQQASRRFAELSTVEHAFINPMLDRVAEDVFDDREYDHSSPYKWGDTD
jgi:hypothetical protein